MGATLPSWPFQLVFLASCVGISLFVDGFECGARPPGTRPRRRVASWGYRIPSLMTISINATHDPNLTSWVDSAGAVGTDFPIQNLPFGVFRPKGDDRARVGVAIGDQIVDVDRCRELGLFEGDAADAAAACGQGSLNALMALGQGHWSALRAALSGLLAAGDDRRETTTRALVPMADAEMLMPAEIGDYTDFYCSIYHATNVGSMFRPDNPLMPNYKHLPVGYHGRASSVVLSGTSVRRPSGRSPGGPRRRGCG